MSEAHSRSRKARHGTELLCERIYRPLAHLLVLPLARLRTPPPLVAATADATGIAAAVELAHGELLAAALVFQVKSVLDNADGQLARLTRRVTAFGRHLDSELDLLVNAALFAALAWRTDTVVLPLLGFLSLTAVLSVNFNAERLSGAEHDGLAPASPAGTGRRTAALRRVYAFLYGWQDALVERFVESRPRGRFPGGRRAYHDRGTVSLLANLGLVAALAARRESLLRGPVSPPEEVT